ncbi:symmetrical bis(5'-nucleosyl)-tetraphosphatase [Thalassomonas sp. M1454]|uniref:symmetrical bis(5'-nucleosyl)-tetraphosphatase n=1 Tax=Thalassomonas sp. M1454 TaxID=2594477 RepID=UPI00117E2C1E|nr:symmetrical bis(5'-nucleosyl)-tetraphosphatase [Thalassomonas sp. M1454]TRX54036.1 symmetrical bis(5'-nucleosyl)-tetraphosphatase [Thalassomonas sp. M1454]
MAIYLVGDIQGCYQELCQLMDKVNFDLNNDQLWLTGDLVARGPDSLATLRMVKSLGPAAKVVLGNHDLHLLAVHAGIKQAKANDKLDTLLNAPDINELTDWLALQPLLLQLPNEQAFVSHAGFCPQWSIATAIEQNHFVQQRLSSKERNHWLTLMYGSMPNSWLLAKSEEERFRFSINAFTRMRFCFNDGSLEFQQKNAPEHNTNAQLQPWFNLQPQLNNIQWVFGHWASLEGHCQHDNVYALDTGCVWGGSLTMLRWHDKQLFSVPAIK